MRSISIRKLPRCETSVKVRPAGGKGCDTIPNTGRCESSKLHFSPAFLETIFPDHHGYDNVVFDEDGFPIALMEADYTGQE